MSSASNVDSSSIDGLQSFAAPPHSVLKTHQIYSSLDQFSASSAIYMFPLIVTETLMLNPALEFRSAVIKETFATTMTFSENYSSVADAARGTPELQPKAPNYLLGIETSRNGQTLMSELLLETSRTRVVASSHSAADLATFETSTKTELITSQTYILSDEFLKSAGTPVIVSPYSTSCLMSSESSMPAEFSTLQTLTVEFSHRMVRHPEIVSDPQSAINVSEILSSVATIAYIASEPTDSPVTSISGDKYDANRTSGKQLVDVFNENFGLFIFLIVIGSVILIVLVFGLSAYIHQSKMTSWTPRMAGQDAYSDMEKSPLSFCKNASSCTENSVPLVDILEDVKHEEETSLSQASTLLCHSASANLHSVNGNIIAMSESYPETNDQNQAEDSSIIIAKEDEHVLHGKINKAFEDREVGHSDGMVPVDELDHAHPRAFFPWIKNAADTEL